MSGTAPPPSYDDVVKGGATPTAPPGDFPMSTRPYGGQASYPAPTQGPPQGYSTGPVAAPYPTGGPYPPQQGAPYPQHQPAQGVPQGQQFGQPYSTGPGQYTYSTVNVAPQVAPGYQTTPLACETSTNNPQANTCLVTVLMVVFIFIVVVVFLSVFL